MYKIVYNRKETDGIQSVEDVHVYPHQFRIKRDAVHYVREIIQNIYREEGYTTELIAKGGLSCLKTEISPMGNRIEREFTIEVKKV